MAHVHDLVKRDRPGAGRGGARAAGPGGALRERARPASCERLEERLGRGMKTVLVCAVQAPFITGGAEILVARAAGEPGAARLPRGRGRGALQVVPGLRDRAPGPGLAAARRDREQRHAGGPRDPHQVPELPGAPPAQGGLALPPAPRGLRPLRHAVLLLHGHARRTSRCARPSSAMDTAALCGVPRDLHDLAQRGRRGCAKYNGLARRRRSIRRRTTSAATARDGYGDYLFYAGRLDRLKRLDLAIDAMQRVRERRAAQDRGQRARWRRSCASRSRAWASAIAWSCWASSPPTTSSRSTRGCRAAYYAPLNEDYGYVTVEAFLSRKPVVTTTDAGGPLEFVTDGETGLVAEPDPEAHRRRPSTRCGRCREARLARDGRGRPRGAWPDITWDHVIDRLTETLSMKLAVWSPLPPSPSGIADYVAEQLPALATRSTCRRWSRTRTPWTQRCARATRWSSPRAGRRPTSTSTTSATRPRTPTCTAPRSSGPGVAVLHDWSLHHLVLHETVERGDTSAYLREMRRAHGETRHVRGPPGGAGAGRRPAARPLPAERPRAGGEPGRGRPDARTWPGGRARACPGRPVLHLPHHAVAAARRRCPRARRRGARLGLPPDALRRHRARPGHRRPSGWTRRVRAVARLRARPPVAAPGGRRRRRSRDCPLQAVGATHAGLGTRCASPAAWTSSDFVRHLCAADVVLALRFPSPRRDVGRAGARPGAWAGPCSSPRARRRPRSSRRASWCPSTPDPARRTSWWRCSTTCCAVPTCAHASTAWPAGTSGSGSACATTAARLTAFLRTSPRGAAALRCARCSSCGRGQGLLGSARYAGARAWRARGTAAASWWTSCAARPASWGFRRAALPRRRCVASWPRRRGARACPALGGDPGLQRGGAACPRTLRAPAGLSGRPGRGLRDRGGGRRLARRHGRTRAQAAGGGRLVVLATRRNRGKGYSVRRGMLAARGRATPDDGRRPLDAHRGAAAAAGRGMDEGYDVAIASRALPGVAHRGAPGRYRENIGRALQPAGARGSRCPASRHPVRVQALHGRRPRRRPSRRARLDGFSFDVEALFIARRAASASPRCRSSGATTPPRAWACWKGAAGLPRPRCASAGNGLARRYGRCRLDAAAGDVGCSGSRPPRAAPSPTPRCARPGPLRVEPLAERGAARPRGPGRRLAPRISAS